MLKDKIKKINIVKESAPLPKSKKYDPFIPFEKLEVGVNCIEIIFNGNTKVESFQSLIRYHSKRFIKYVNPDARFTIRCKDNKIKIYRIK